MYVKNTGYILVYVCVCVCLSIYIYDILEGKIQKIFFREQQFRYD